MKLDEFRTTPHPADAGKHVEFRYVNWRGDEHAYVVDPEGFAVGTYDATGHHPESPLAVVLHGDVVTRDGDPREDMHPRRRTFLVEKIRDLKLVSS